MIIIIDLALTDSINYGSLKRMMIKRINDNDFLLIHLRVTIHSLHGNRLSHKKLYEELRIT